MKENIVDGVMKMGEGMMDGRDVRMCCGDDGWARCEDVLWG
ncbi:hypothetical protein [Corynebacterium anserum]|nr:hypothetical protein [Corynebacterium anserum]